MILLKTIALLCQISWGGYVIDIEQKQLECQVFYVNCMGDSLEPQELKKCILLRAIRERKQK